MQFLVIRRIQKGEGGVCDLEKGQGAASRAAGGLEETQPQVGKRVPEERGSSLQDKRKK